MCGGARATQGGRLRFGAFEFSPARRELLRDGQLVDIGRRGLDLLAALLADAGQPVPKERLVQAAWGGRAIERSNLTVQVAMLRRQLGHAPEDPSAAEPMIRTVPGFGYVFAAPVAAVGDAPDAVTPAGTVPRGAAALPADHGQLVEPLTHFIGREEEGRDLARMLSASRLVTVTGMGGVGKTRLAMHMRHELAAAYDDGAVLVDLAPLVEADQLDEAVARALGAGGGDAAAQDALISMLCDRRLLLILDNAEHLDAAVARLVGRILAGCPLVSALVTSRESLGLPGEAVFRLSPLKLPPDDVAPTAAEVLGYDSVQLLVDRAQALLPELELDDATAPHAVEICRRLDGIALAIEMAVPRLGVLSFKQLAERLQDRFGVLARPRHDVPPRQRTLRAMFDWSWELLSPGEQHLLQLLAVSAVGTDLEMLEAMAAPGGDVLDQLARLARSSLVVVTAPEHGAAAERRYRLLGTTRQYVLERLAPAQRDMLGRRYAQLVAALFERADAEWPAMNSAAWLDRYGPDADNLRSCLQWAFARPEETELALRLAAASFPLWWELPGLPLREARSWYAQALAHVGPGTPPGVEARLRLGHTWTDTLDGNIETFPTVMRAAELFRAAGDAVGLGAALWRAAGAVSFREHVPSAAVLVAEAARHLARQPARKWQALCRVLEADLLQAEGAFLPALAKYDEAWGALRALQYGYGLMMCGANRSYALFALGRHQEAIAVLRDLQRTLPPGLRHPILSLLAITLAACGQDDEARVLALEGLAGMVTIGMVGTLARSIEALALLTVRSGDSASAAKLLGFVLAHHRPDRPRLGPRRAVFEQLQVVLATALPPDAREQLLAEGASWTEHDAVAVATSACGGPTDEDRPVPVAL